MSDTPPTRRPLQFSLGSLFVVTTVIAVLCSIGVCTDWGVTIVLAVGIGVSLVGFHLFSLREHPSLGIAFAVLGFVVRFVGLTIISFGLMLLVVQVGFRLWPR